MDIRNDLSALVEPADDEYRKFSKRIVATGYEILGVRTPALRAYAKRLTASPDADEYLRNGLAGLRGRLSDTASGVLSGASPDDPPETSADGSPVVWPVHEEVMLYGLVLAARSRKMPLEDVLTLLDGLIPYFDSWAHVDVIISDFKIFARHRDEVLRHFMPLKTDPGEFTKRTFVILLMDFFLDDTHIDSALGHLSEVPQGQYYVDMAIAWALSVGLVKHYERTEPLLRRPVFSRFVHNKAIQKARESFRITPEQKEYLGTLKI